MRFLSQIRGRAEAESFVAYLMTQSVETHIEGASQDPELWDLWVRDEDDLEKARTELREFEANPRAEKYVAAVPEARRIIREKQEAARAAAQNVRKVQHRSPGPMGAMGGGRIPPLTLTLLILCVVVSLFSNFGNSREKGSFAQRVYQQLSFVSEADYRTSGEDPAASIKRGEVWRVFTPIFLHGDPLHLVFNMIMLVMLGRIAESIDGTGRYALLVLLLTLLPNLLAGLMPPQFGGSPFFVGISGVVYGFATYLWMLTQNRPELGVRIPNNVIFILILFMVLGFSGVLPRMSNWSHLGGFVTGLVIGLMSRR